MGAASGLAGSDVADATGNLSQANRVAMGLLSTRLRGTSPPRKVVGPLVPTTVRNSRRLWTRDYYPEGA